jgi:hypothetical protein
MRIEPKLRSARGMAQCQFVLLRGQRQRTHARQSIHSVPIVLRESVRIKDMRCVGDGRQRDNDEERHERRRVVHWRAEVATTRSVCAQRAIVATEQTQLATLPRRRLPDALCLIETRFGIRITAARSVGTSSLSFIPFARNHGVDGDCQGRVFGRHYSSARYCTACLSFVAK